MRIAVRELFILFIAPIDATTVLTAWANVMDTANGQLERVRRGDYQRELIGRQSCPPTPLSVNRSRAGQRMLPYLETAFAGGKHLPGIQSIIRIEQILEPLNHLERRSRKQLPHEFVLLH